jgi:serine/threonine protein kinase
MQNLSGRTIKGYELRDCLGAGGFGAVYKASQASVGREVAIKIILPGLANQPDFIRRFETEAQVIARLEHHSIVPLYDYWREPDGAYLVMRWLRGGSLADLLKNGALDIETTARILDQVSAALAFAHRSNIIHRDMKPGNILLDEDNNAYLADFGIAKDLRQPDGSGTQVDAIVGSLDYISPEQARSEPVTPRTDIYSLGVVLYEMLTGQHPFPGITSIERLYKHINDPLPEITTLDDAIGDAVNQVVQTATAKNPALRYEDALQMALAFKEAAGLNRTSSSTIVELLTRREQEVVSLLVTGATNKDIAQKLFITVPTVKWYLNEIFRKLRVRSRVQAIVRARELNLIVSAADSSDETAPSVMLDNLPEPENPYKGLKAFQAADERDFFGREDFVQKLLKRLTPVQSLTKTDDTIRFLAVVGPSGGGKSSVVRAGLIPALLRGGLPGSDRWFVVEMLPGAHPFDELEVALLKIAPNQAQLRDQLLRDERGLIRAAQLLLPQDDSELVIVIDQFEEVFTLVSDETQRQRFLALLVAAVTDPRSRIRIVVTLRADFYDRPLNYPEFGELLRSHIETLLPLSAKGLEQAIIEPARRVGVKFEDGLATTIISDVNYQAGALPLLQYALTELFEQREGRLLTHAAYLKIGRAVGALAKRAEDIYQELTPEAQAAAQQVFLRLVTPGDGTEDTRRRVARSELRYAIATSVPTPSPEQPSQGAAPLHGEGNPTPDPSPLRREGNYWEELVEEIVDTYAEYRLLALDNDPATRTPTVEVAHEALLREWERLRSWLNDSRDDIRLQRQLAAQADEWEKSKRDKSYLLTGSRLEQYETWIQQTPLALTEQERQFVSASLTRRQHETTLEQERQAREKNLEKRSQNFLRGLVAVFAVATVIALFLMTIAFYESNRANNAIAAEQNARLMSEERADYASSIALASAARNALFLNNPDQAIALAVAANAVTDAPSAFSRNILYESAFTPATRWVLPEAGFDRVVISPDGNHALALRADNSAAYLDVNAGEILTQWTPTFMSADDLICADGLLFAPSGETAYVEMIAPDFSTGAVIEFEVATGVEIRRFVPPKGFPCHISYSPNKEKLFIPTLVSQEDTNILPGTIYEWDVATGNLISELPLDVSGLPTDIDIYLSISADGSEVVGAFYSGSIILWDRNTGERLLMIKDETLWRNDLDLS